MDPWSWQHPRTDHKDSAHPREILFSVLSKKMIKRVVRSPLPVEASNLREDFIIQTLYKTLRILLKKFLHQFLCRQESVRQHSLEMATLKIHIAAIN